MPEKSKYIRGRTKRTVDIASEGRIYAKEI